MSSLVFQRKFTGLDQRREGEDIGRKARQPQRVDGFENGSGAPGAGKVGDKGVPCNCVGVVGVGEEATGAREVAGAGEGVDDGSGEEGVEDEAGFEEEGVYDVGEVGGLGGGRGGGFLEGLWIETAEEEGFNGGGDGWLVAKRECGE